MTKDIDEPKISRYKEIFGWTSVTAMFLIIKFHLNFNLDFDFLQEYNSINFDIFDPMSGLLGTKVKTSVSKQNLIILLSIVLNLRNISSFINGAACKFLRYFGIGKINFLQNG